MAITFNLITEHWIPCIRADGTLVELSLRETLNQAPALREVRGDTPTETAALTRLLLVVLHRVFSTRNTSEWRKLWLRREQGFDMAAMDAYFEQWQHRFDLFDSVRPFMQARDARVSDKPMTSLVLHMASGNNGTLFDHHLEDFDVRLSPAQAARALLVSQAFGIGGLSGLPEKFTDAPCAKGILFFAQGDTLAETLMLNMVRVTGEEPIAREDDDCPAWERDDPFVPERSKPRGYLDYLTWHNRKVWLSAIKVDDRIWVDRMCWAPGLRLDATDVDPHKYYIQNEQDGWNILSFRSDKALWRDSAALLQISVKTRQPAVVRWLGTLAGEGKIDTARPLRLMALGLAKDRASMEFLRAENLPLPLPYLQDQTQVSRLSRALGLSEAVAKVLYLGQLALARWMLKPDAEDGDLSSYDRENIKALATSWQAEQRYWSQMELRFAEMVVKLPDEPEAAFESWCSHLRHAAKDAYGYAEACAGTDVRAYRARAIARQSFERDLNYTLADRNKTPTSAGQKGDA